jgi:hypothetical protein
VDPAWAVAAFGMGLGVAALAILVFQPEPSRAGPAPRLTSTWRLEELDHPTVVAGDVDLHAVPPGTRLLASGHIAPDLLPRALAHRVPSVPGAFALDRDARRGLLFLGPVRDGTWALSIAQPALLQRLRAEAESLAAAATPYAERRRVADLAGPDGLPVEAEGTVLEVLPRPGAHLVRLEDDGQVAAVRAPQVPDGVVGKRVVVRGRLGRDPTGYPIVEADDVRIL